jgi:UDP-glucose 4-epimerase
VKQILLSSSAAVYGSVGRGPIDEEARLSPVNPYGATKVALEGALRFYAEAHGLRAVALRYFNVAGSTGKVSERHNSETHLIPILVAAARSGETFKLFGDDYPTDDGSAVRDYVHVADVADAHVAALTAIAALPNERGLGAYLPVNIGSGRGTSVYEAIRAVERATGRTINVKVEARRPGDPARLVADVSRAGKALGWRPKRTTIAEIIKGVA